MKKLLGVFLTAALLFGVLSAAGCSNEEADGSSSYFSEDSFIKLGENAYSSESSDEATVAESAAGTTDCESAENILSHSTLTDGANGIIGEGYSSWLYRAGLRIYEKETVDKWLAGTSNQKIQVLGREESVYSDSYLEKGRFLINKYRLYTPTVSGILQKSEDKTVNIFCHATFTEVEYPSFNVGEASVSVHLFYLDESYAGDRKAVDKETLEAINKEKGQLYIEGIDDMASIDFGFAGAKRQGLITSGENPWLFFYYEGVLAAVKIPTGFYETEDFAKLSFSFN